MLLLLRWMLPACHRSPVNRSSSTREPVPGSPLLMPAEQEGDPGTMTPGSETRPTIALSIRGIA